MKNEWIGVLDCNNFFVSCERLFRPDLHRKPVVVMSSNDGCIVARSKEVKDMGIAMGVPYFQVKDILNKHQTIAFSSHFALYRDLSRRVFEVMREELDIIEEYSIDEAFFTVDGDPEVVAKRVKEAVETRVGIPVSVGIARTKTLAKYANSVAKKSNGVFHLTDEIWSRSQVSVPIQTIWGVGGRSEISYKEQGIKTVKDLLRTDTGRLRSLFGISGVRLQSELNGVSVLALNQVKTNQKSIMSSRSFAKETSDVSVIKDAVAYHLRQTLRSLRRSELKAKALRVSILTSRHGDFLLRGGSKETILNSPTDDNKELLGVANQLVDELYENGVPYKKAGITLNNLTSDEVEQTSLFATTDQKNESWQMINEVMDKLNQRERNTVLLGSRLRQDHWQAKKESRSPAYTTNWKELVEVKA